MSFVDPNLPDVRLIEALSANLRHSLACVEPAVANRSCAAYLQIWAKLAVERLGRDEAAALMRGAAADAGVQLVQARLVPKPPPAS